MASDAYLKIEGIDGESEDERRRNWIEVSNVIYAVNQPRAESVSTAGGHTNGKAELHPNHLQEACRLGLADPAANLRNWQNHPKGGL